MQALKTFKCVGKILHSWVQQASSCIWLSCCSVHKLKAAFIIILNLNTITQLTVPMKNWSTLTHFARMHSIVRSNSKFYSGRTGCNCYFAKLLNHKTFRYWEKCKYMGQCYSVSEHSELIGIAIWLVSQLLGTESIDPVLCSEIFSIVEPTRTWGQAVVLIF